MGYNRIAICAFRFDEIQLPLPYWRVLLRRTLLSRTELLSDVLKRSRTLDFRASGCFLLTRTARTK